MRSSQAQDTIFALATASGRSGVAVFRLSGVKAGDIARQITGKPLPASRVVKLAVFYDALGEAVDEGLLLYMPGPNSFTGETCVEFHCHGSPAVIEAMGSVFLSAGARQAEAGEFTRRAFENGRLDLTEVEGLADLIDAETEGQRAQALRQMQGGLSGIYADWKEKILDILAQIEGEIDFPDEGDIPDDLSHAAEAPLSLLIAAMAEKLSDAERGERIRAGLDIAIIGAPNAGKSSLINILAGRDAAIVTSQAGTTRDIIDVPLEIAGLAVRLSDTAGLRDSDDMIEAEGVKRAKTKAQEADIRIWVIDAANQDAHDEVHGLIQSGDMIVMNKMDVANAKPRPGLSLPINGVSTHHLSAKTGDGLPVFRDALQTLVKDRFSPSHQPGLTRARHRNCVQRAHDALMSAQTALGRAPELAGDDLRAALRALRELAGEADIEAVFDRIFSRFCVGK